ncbi:MAG TPA: Flp pilus assembly protein CpaB [Actinomycetota bacterium]|nr:Flp pilus assembly protein CpaB [Actinomycetota bacterium]
MTTLILSRRRASRWSVLAVLAAVTTALAVYSYLSSLRAQIPVFGRMVPMVVASTDIDSGVVIKPGMVEVVDHPERYLPQDALENPSLAIGRVAAVPILQGEPVTSRRVGRDAGSSSVVPDGMRAYSLSPQTLEGLALAPKAGDRVDVIATFARDGGNAETVTVIRAAKVASVGSGEGGSGVASQLGVGGSSAGGITLLLTPEQAEVLAQSEALGKIALVLAPNAGQS